MIPSPSPSDSCPSCGHPLEGQLRFYEMSDPEWTQVMLTHLAEGGCIVIERTGDLLIMPAARA